MLELFGSERGIEMERALWSEHSTGGQRTAEQIQRAAVEAEIELWNEQLAFALQRGDNETAAKVHGWIAERRADMRPQTSG